MKILVTGASGFIGQHVISMLAAHGHEVVAITHSQGQVLPQPNVQIVHQDLLDCKSQSPPWLNIRADYLIHLAWCTKPGEYWATTKNVDWLRATITLVESFAQSGGRRVVIAGSCAEYSWQGGCCIEDRTALEPSTLYGQAKLATYQLLQHVCSEVELDLLWGRVFFPYGPGESSQRLLPTVITGLLSNTPVHCSHGMQRRDFIHVKDVASALIHLLLSNCESGAYNLSTGTAVSIRELVKRCSDIIDSRSDIIYGAIPVPKNDPAELYGTNSKLIKTGWSPSASLDQGLREYIGHLKANGPT